jgi:hypothetical protein
MKKRYVNTYTIIHIQDQQKIIFIIFKFLIVNLFDEKINK